jgi:hypothetical protein
LSGFVNSRDVRYAFRERSKCAKPTGKNCDEIFAAAFSEIHSEKFSEILLDKEDGIPLS